jgi:hypothetical protein
MHNDVEKLEIEKFVSFLFTVPEFYWQDWRILYVPYRAL